jgi:hypothetical protein
MKNKLIILLLLSLLLTSCEIETSTQDIEVVTEAPSTEVPATEVTVEQESIETEPPTEAPTEPPLACVTLLAPLDGVDIPPVGKVTFSWTPMDEAGMYILNIILPSGEIVYFETDQTFRDRYMEAFVAGGDYQWKVIVQDIDGSEICVSEVASFDKPAYEKPKASGNNGSDDGGGGDDPFIIIEG